MQVREIMNKKVNVINYQQTVAEAARLMAENGYGALPVEKNDKMVGMVTDRDIVTRVVARHQSPETQSVESCMTEGIDFCYEDEEIENLAKKMVRSKHGRMPVVNREKRLTGIVSLRDLILKSKSSTILNDAMEGLLQ